LHVSIISVIRYDKTVGLFVALFSIAGGDLRFSCLHRKHALLVRLKCRRDLYEVDRFLLRDVMALHPVSRRCGRRVESTGDWQTLFVVVLLLLLLEEVVAETNSPSSSTIRAFKRLSFHILCGRCWRQHDNCIGRSIRSMSPHIIIFSKHSRCSHRRLAPVILILRMVVVTLMSASVVLLCSDW